MVVEISPIPAPNRLGVRTTTSCRRKTSLSDDSPLRNGESISSPITSSSSSVPGASENGQAPDTNDKQPHPRKRRCKQQRPPVALMAFLLTTFFATWRLVSNEHLNRHLAATIRSSAAPRQPKFAYAFLVGGIDSQKPAYRYYVYDILITAYLLREYKSRADIVAYFQPSTASTSSPSGLAKEELEWLKHMNVQVRVLPDQNKATTKSQASFYSLVLQKFLVWSLTEYERVMFLDSDVVPLMNLDFVMEMSANGILKQNVVVAGFTEPANAGCFVLTPSPGAYDEIQQIIRQKDERVSKLPFPHWDKKLGWGHVITPPDRWKGRGNTSITKMYRNGNQNGTMWKFHAAFSDQGLLYHYTKYVQKAVSIIYPDGLVESWGPSGNNTPGYEVAIEKVLSNPFARIAPDAGKICFELGYRRSIMAENDIYECWGPVAGDYLHYTGTRKPWLVAPPSDVSFETRYKSPSHFWYYTLQQVDEELGMRLDFGNWTPGILPVLGLFATPKSVERTFHRK